MVRKASGLLRRRKTARPPNRHLTNHNSPTLFRKKITSNQAQIVANEHSLLHYAVGYKGSTPRRVTLKNKGVWVVPIVLTSPGYGIVGEVGVVVIDAGTGEVLGATRPEEVRAAGNKVTEEKRAEIDAAFHRARTV